MQFIDIFKKVDNGVHYSFEKFETSVEIENVEPGVNVVMFLTKPLGSIIVLNDDDNCADPDNCMVGYIVNANDPIDIKIEESKITFTHNDKSIYFDLSGNSAVDDIRDTFKSIGLSVINVSNDV